MGVRGRPGQGEGSGTATASNVLGATQSGEHRPGFWKQLLFCPNRNWHHGSLARSCGPAPGETRCPLPGFRRQVFAEPQAPPGATRALWTRAPWRVLVQCTLRLTRGCNLRLMRSALCPGGSVSATGRPSPPFFSGSQAEVSHTPRPEEAGDPAPPLALLTDRRHPHASRPLPAFIVLEGLSP